MHIALAFVYLQSQWHGLGRRASKGAVSLSIVLGDREGTGGAGGRGGSLKIKKVKYNRRIGT